MKFVDPESASATIMARLCVLRERGTDERRQVDPGPGRRGSPGGRRRPQLHEQRPVGHGGARLEAESRGIPYLGEIPLDIQIRETSDDGRHIVATEPDSVHALQYTDHAR